MLNMIIPEFWNQYSQAISSLLSGNLNNWMVYSEMVFPRIAKCTYESYGSSGTLQQFDALCLLPLNILNQKLFIIIWIWYIIQLILSILNLIYWIIISFSLNIRVFILYRKSMKSLSRKVILNASCEAHLGHFFVLNQIAKNTNYMTFVELLSNLSQNTIANHDQNEDNLPLSI